MRELPQADSLKCSIRLLETKAPGFGGSLVYFRQGFIAVSSALHFLTVLISG